MAQNFFVVGIGYSAGGLSAVETFFDHLPPPFRGCLCGHPSYAPNVQKPVEIHIGKVYRYARTFHTG